MKHLIVIGSAFAATLGLAIASGGRVAASSDAPPPSSPKFYATRVTDILSDNCLSCHDDTAKGGLRLDSYAGILKGGSDGAVIVPGDPNASMLIQAIRRAGELKMPPKRPLSDAEIADLEAWGLRRRRHCDRWGDGDSGDGRRSQDGAVDSRVPDHRRVGDSERATIEQRSTPDAPIRRLIESHKKVAASFRPAAALSLGFLEIESIVRKPNLEQPHRYCSSLVTSC